jgi:hypothetical protein
VSLLNGPPDKSGVRAAPGWNRNAAAAARSGTTRFNRACALFSLLWLAVVPRLDPLRVGLDTVDFPQLYMGGAMVRLHAGRDLYPIPRAGSPHHPGLPLDSTMRPAFAAVAESLGLENAARYIQSPPTALLFTPMACMPFKIAALWWKALVTAAAFGIAWCAGRIFVLASNRRSRWEGILFLAVATSPRTWAAVRFANVTPIEGLLLGWIPCWLLLGRQARAGAAMLGGVLLKYASIVFVPLVAALHGWRALLWCAVFSAVLVAVSLVVMGTGPYTIFLREILPTFGRPYLDPFNQSIWSCLPRWLGEGRSPAWMRPAVSGTAALLLLWVGVGLFRRPVAERRQPEMVFSAAAALIAWFLLFSPICWNSYQLYLMPFWGTLLWSGLRSRAWITLTAALVGFGSVPWMTVYPHVFGTRPPELLISSGFWANAGYFGTAAWWLWRGPRRLYNESSAGRPAAIARSSL